ncbi:hypothetical protein [Aquiflexum sp.]|uniref:hypothetical protein n=1 Tax=Aquiflexum sp. TaxID=1872584 RepID=UPI003593B746
MRRQLLELFQAFTYGIFCVSIIAASMWFSKTSETSPSRTIEASFEKVSKGNGTVYLDWKTIFFSGSSISSFSSQENNINQMGAFSSVFGDLSFNEYQSFLSFEISERLKFTNILDQLHHSYFFF